VESIVQQRFNQDKQIAMEIGQFEPPGRRISAVAAPGGYSVE